MSRKQVVILWVIAIVLAVSAVAVKSRSGKGFDSHTARARGQTLFANFPAKDVAQIRITSGKESTTLVRKDGNWTVGDRAGYPANINTVNEFLRQIDEVKVVEGVEAQPSYAPRFGMDLNADKKEEQGTEAIFLNEGGSQIAAATLGKKLGGGDEMMGGAVGRFVKNNADETGVYKVSEMFPGVSAKPADWLDKQFLTIDKITGISTSQEGKPETDWKLTRENEDADFTLVGKEASEALDPAALNPLKNLFSSSTFEDVASADDLKAVDPASPKRIVEITTAEGFHYKLTVVQAAAPEAADANAEAPQTSYLVTVDVDATLPAERKKEDKESEADAKTRDTAFADRKKVLEKRLAEQKAFVGRTFKVSSWTVDAVAKDRSDLIKKPGAPGAAQGRGGLQGFPGGQGGLGGLQVQGVPARRPVQAVTPPIAVPPVTPPPAEAPKPAPAKEEAPKEATPAEEPPAKQDTVPETPKPAESEAPVKETAPEKKSIEPPLPGNDAPQPPAEEKPVPENGDGN